MSTVTKPSAQDLALYQNVPEIHAAVRAVADITERFHCSRLTPDEMREELFDDLVRFFASFDRMRTDEVENLKAQLKDALAWSVKPLRLGISVRS